MHDDDRPHGRILTRREALGLLGAAGVTLIAGCSRDPDPDPAAAAPARAPGAGSAMPQCVVRPEQIEGPYFVDEMLNRSDLRRDPSDGNVVPGTPLALEFAVSRLDGGRCTPLAGALVDVWQCDALGVYSGVVDRDFDTLGRQFLRGHQITGADGAARFTTIYPGWYPGRTVHVHFKLRSGPQAREGFEFTSQLYFDDELTDRVHAVPPYAGRGARTRNERDGIFRDGGAQLLLDVNRATEGYAARFEVALQLG